MKLGALVRDWLPPPIVSLVRMMSGRSNRFTGTYRTWKDAVAASTGYDSDNLLAEVIVASRKVSSGAAAFERDSVVFSKHSYPFHIISPLLKAAIENGGSLSVMDYGGSLGSSYYQCRPFLPTTNLRWNVIEQPKFVAAGQREFETNELRFYREPADIPSDVAPQVSLFSSVLQYLERPFEALSLANRESIRYLVIDRTPFVRGMPSHLCVQRVPKRIYQAAYPMWIISYEDMLRELEPMWTLIADFTSAEGSRFTSDFTRFEFRGLILEKRVAA